MPIDPFAALNAMLRAEATRAADERQARQRQQAAESGPVKESEPRPPLARTVDDRRL
ncbi:hypothetical protein ACH41E_28560 [Streptomyces sp. NPDC020412]|uniref:hypothetical protein n=1 Tax=Streptomyces sp. NPDC020412 TaxID=3365073 RepID=UPI0037B1C35B